MLYFAVSPLIVRSPDNVQAPVGSRVQFDCQVTGNPRPTVKWQRDSIPVPLTTSHKHQVTPDGSLVIQDVNRNDVGVYECIAENFAGTAHAEAFLEVVGELMQLTMECTVNVTGNMTDSGPGVHWRHLSEVFMLS